MTSTILYIYKLDGKIKYVVSDKEDLIHYLYRDFNLEVDKNESIPIIEDKLRESGSGYHELKQMRVNL